MLTPVVTIPQTSKTHLPTTPADFSANQNIQQIDWTLCSRSVLGLGAVLERSKSRFSTYPKI